MQDPMDVSAAPRTVTVGGETLALHPLTFDDWCGPVQDWVDRQFPDPFDVVSRQVATGRYTITQQQFLMKTAMELSTKSRRLVGSPEADEVLQAARGVKFLLTLAVRKGNPAFSDADADRLYGKMTIADVGRVFKATTADLVFSDPKAGAGTTTPPGTTTA